MVCWRRGTVRVRVPATSANLGPGFDSFGLALSLHDEITVEVTSHGIGVQVVGEGAGRVPQDEGHLVLRSMLAACDLLGARPPGLVLEAVNRIPHGRGLGSSAGAIVGGVLAARTLADADLPDDVVLRLCSELEGHPDNVAACLHGGFTVAWTCGSGVHALRLDPHPAVVPVVCVPAEELSTQKARGLLPRSVPHADAAANSARAALLVSALTAHPSLLLAATEDRLHQEYRRAAMPRSLALVDQLRAAGVAAVVSGAGPSVLALTDARTAESVARLAGAQWAVSVLDVDTVGATVDVLP